MREYARGIGDTGLESACNADLSRYGYRDEPVMVFDEAMALADVPLREVLGEGSVEIAVPVDELERAVPDKPRRGGRPKLPRCEHNNIVGRCDACDEEDD